jgi:hypothetical protein
MRITALAFVLVTAAATAAVDAQQPFEFFATFVGGNGQPLTAVAATDVEVRENDMPATVVKVERVDWPVRVELILDNGAGMGAENLIHLRNGLRGFVEALPMGVEASIFTLAPQPRMVIKPTTDRAELLKAEGLITPDAGAGRFLDALVESAGRVDQTHGDKTGGRYFPVVVALASTAAGGRSPVERTLSEMLERFGRHAATVHVVMLTSASQSGGGAQNQTQIGIGVTELTGGRYENISAPSRIATLLPELAAKIAASHARQLQQFRIAAQRPAGASGELGRVTVRANNAVRAQLSLDGHLP